MRVFPTNNRRLPTTLLSHCRSGLLYDHLLFGLPASLCKDTLFDAPLAASSCLSIAQLRSVKKYSTSSSAGTKVAIELLQACAIAVAKSAYMVPYKVPLISFRRNRSSSHMPQPISGLQQLHHLLCLCSRQRRRGKTGFTFCAAVPLTLLYRRLMHLRCCAKLASLPRPSHLLALATSKGRP